MVKSTFEPGISVTVLNCADERENASCAVLSEGPKDKPKDDYDTGAIANFQLSDCLNTSFFIPNYNGRSALNNDSWKNDIVELLSLAVDIETFIGKNLKDARFSLILNSLKDLRYKLSAVTEYDEYFMNRMACISTDIADLAEISLETLFHKKGGEYLPAKYRSEYEKALDILRLLQKKARSAVVADIVSELEGVFSRNAAQDNDSKVLLAAYISLKRGVEAQEVIKGLAEGGHINDEGFAGRIEPITERELNDLAANLAKQKADEIEALLGRAARQHVPVELERVRSAMNGARGPLERYLLFPDSLDDKAWFAFFSKAEGEHRGENVSKDDTITGGLRLLRNARDVATWLEASAGIEKLMNEPQKGPRMILQKLRADRLVSEVRWLLEEAKKTRNDDDWFTKTPRDVRKFCDLYMGDEMAIPEGYDDIVRFSSDVIFNINHHIDPVAEYVPGMGSLSGLRLEPVVPDIGLEWNELYQAGAMLVDRVVQTSVNNIGVYVPVMGSNEMKSKDMPVAGDVKPVMDVIAIFKALPETGEFASYYGGLLEKMARGKASERPSAKYDLWNVALHDLKARYDGLSQDYHDPGRLRSLLRPEERTLIERILIDTAPKKGSPVSMDEVSFSDAFRGLKLVFQLNIVASALNTMKAERQDFNLYSARSGDLTNSLQVVRLISSLVKMNTAGVDPGFYIGALEAEGFLDLHDVGSFLKRAGSDFDCERLRGIASEIGPVLNEFAVSTARVRGGILRDRFDLIALEAVNWEVHAELLTERDLKKECAGCDEGERERELFEAHKKNSLTYARELFHRAEGHWRGSAEFTLSELANRLKEVRTLEEWLGLEMKLEMTKSPNYDLNILGQTMKALWLVDEYVPYARSRASKERGATRYFPHADLTARIVLDKMWMVTDGYLEGKLVRDPDDFIRGFKYITDNDVRVNYPEFLADGLLENLRSFNDRLATNLDVVDRVRRSDIASAQIGLELATLFALIGGVAASGWVSTYMTQGMRFYLMGQGVEFAGLQGLLLNTALAIPELAVSTAVFEGTIDAGMAPFTGLPTWEEAGKSYGASLLVFGALRVVGAVTGVLAGLTGKNFGTASRLIEEGSIVTREGLKLGRARYGSIRSMNFWRTLKSDYLAGKVFLAQQHILKASKAPSLGGTLRFLGSFAVLDNGSLLNEWIFDGLLGRFLKGAAWLRPRHANGGHLSDFEEDIEGKLHLLFTLVVLHAVGGLKLFPQEEGVSGRIAGFRRLFDGAAKKLGEAVRLSRQPTAETVDDAVRQLQRGTAADPLARKELLGAMKEYGDRLEKDLPTTGSIEDMKEVEGRFRNAVRGFFDACGSVHVGKAEVVGWDGLFRPEGIDVDNMIGHLLYTVRGRVYAGPAKKLGLKPLGLKAGKEEAEAQLKEAKGVYLAKARRVHPDLGRTEEERQRREIQMKELRGYYTRVKDYLRMYINNAEFPEFNEWWNGLITAGERALPAEAESLMSGKMAQPVNRSRKSATIFGTPQGPAGRRGVSGPNRPAGTVPARGLFGGLMAYLGEMARNVVLIPAQIFAPSMVPWGAGGGDDIVTGDVSPQIMEIITAVGEKDDVAAFRGLNGLTSAKDRERLINELVGADAPFSHLFCNLIASAIKKMRDEDPTFPGEELRKSLVNILKDRTEGYAKRLLGELASPVSDIETAIKAEEKKHDEPFGDEFDILQAFVGGIKNNTAHRLTVLRAIEGLTWEDVYKITNERDGKLHGPVLGLRQLESHISRFGYTLPLFALEFKEGIYCAAGELYVDEDTARFFDADDIFHILAAKLKIDKKWNQDAYFKELAETGDFYTEHVGDILELTGRWFVVDLIGVIPPMEGDERFNDFLIKNVEVLLRDQDLNFSDLVTALARRFRPQAGRVADEFILTILSHSLKDQPALLERARKTFSPKDMRTSTEFREGLLSLAGLMAKLPAPAAEKMEEFLLALPEDHSTWKKMAKKFHLMAFLPDVAISALEMAGEAAGIDEYSSAFLKGLTEHAKRVLQLTPEETRLLDSSISQHIDLWEEKGLLEHILGIISFSDERGKGSAKRLLLKLAAEGADFPDRFEYLRRYFDGEFFERWKKADRTLDISGFWSAELAGDTAETARELARGTAHRILGHFGGSGTANADTVREHLGRIKLPEKDQDNQKKNFIESLVRFISDLQGEARSESPNVKRHQGRAQKIMNFLTVNSRLSPLFQQVAGDLRAFVREISELGKKTRSIEGVVEFTKRPSDMIVKGNEPAVTCQQTYRATGQNESGQVTNAVLYGQFALARFRVRENGNSHIGARLMLEITTGDGHPVLIANNFYSDGMTDNLRVLKAGVRYYAKIVLGIDPNRDVIMKDDPDEGPDKYIVPEGDPEFYRD